MKHEKHAGKNTAGMISKPGNGQVGVSSPTAHNQILLGPSSGLKSAFSAAQPAPGQPKPTKEILNAQGTTKISG